MEHILNLINGLLAGIDISFRCEVQKPLIIKHHRFLDISLPFLSSVLVYRIIPSNHINLLFSFQSYTIFA